MQEISGIVGGHMNQSQVQKSSKPAAAEFSFIDAARAALKASPIAVAEKGNLDELNLRRKEEVNQDLLKLEEEEEDIFDLIKHFQKVLKRFQEDS